jgi:tetratricopeptide (TPR) repeat protein
MLTMKNPTPYAHRLKAYINLRSRLYDEAIAEAERAIALAPNDPMMHGCMAYILNHAGSPKEAINYAKKAMRQDPGYTAWALSRIGKSHFCMGQLEEAVTFLEKAIMHSPEIPEPYVLLAASYAHLNRNEKARAMLDNYKKRFIANNLREIMYFWPFKDFKVAERLADGLLKAGLPGEPSGYYKILDENKLSAEEIKKLTFGRTRTGVNIATGDQWWITTEKDGKFEVRIENWLGLGRVWFEGDRLCIQYEKLFSNLKACSYIYRNPEGTPEGKNELLAMTPYWIVPWSVVD